MCYPKWRKELHRQLLSLLHNREIVLDYGPSVITGCLKSRSRNLRRTWQTAAGLKAEGTTWAETQVAFRGREWPLRTDSKDAGPHAHSCESLVSSRGQRAWKENPKPQNHRPGQSSEFSCGRPELECCCSSVARSCPALHAVDSSTPGSLCPLSPEFAQIHIDGVTDAI